MAYILIWVRLNHLPLRLSVQEPTVRVLGIYAMSHIVFPPSLVFSLFSFLFFLLYITPHFLYFCLFSFSLSLSFYFCAGWYFSSFSVLLFVLSFSVPLSFIFASTSIFSVLYLCIIVLTISLFLILFCIFSFLLSLPPIFVF